MKVKNIMFSGFMAAVLAGACGAADAATVLASKEFVVEKLADKQDTLTAGTNIKIDPATNTISSTYEYNDSALSQKVTDLETTIGASEEALGGKTIVEYIDAKTEGVSSTEAVTQLQNKVNAVEGKLAGLPADKTVAQEIAAAVGNKQDTLTFDATPTENSANPVTSGGVYTALSGKADASDIPTVPTNVSAFTNDANYVTSTELSGMGYQTKGDVTTAIGNANIAMGQVTGLTTALDDKAAASDVESLQTTVEGFTNETTGIKATYATKSELAGYATDDELNAVSGVANTAKTTADTAKTTADTAKATAEAALPAATFTTFQQTVNAEAIAEAKKAGTDATEALNSYKGEMTTTLAGKVDNAELDNYYTKTQADEKFLEDADLANGSAYLVTKNSEGKVVYSEVSVIGENGQTVIGKAQQL